MIRRSLYAVLLMLGMPLASAAADAPGIAAKAPTPRAIRNAQKLELNLGRPAPAPDVFGRDDDALETRGELLPGEPPGVSARTGARGSRLLLLRLDVAPDPVRQLRSGLSANLVLPAFGRFHLTLYGRRGAELSGNRWELGGTGSANPPAWSLGGRLDAVRIPEDDRRHLVLVPQLALDLSRLLGAPGRLDAHVQLGHWHDQGGQAVSDETLPQLTLRWKY